MCSCSGVYVVMLSETFPHPVLALLYRSGPVPDAVPISLDEGVETIGEAFMADMDRKAAEQMIGEAF